jgi:thiamine-phosphate pyrophosphorylase
MSVSEIPRVVLITRPQAVAGEAEACAAALAAHPLLIIHLRKPRWPLAALAWWCADVPPALRSRISVHADETTARQLGVGGHHQREATATVDLRASRSCHRVEELPAARAAGCAYVFLSPVFPSISKPGYGREALAGWAAALAAAPVRPPVLALGGISPERMPALAAAGFAGGAVLGWAWAEGCRCLPARLAALVGDAG